MTSTNGQQIPYICSTGIKKNFRISITVEYFLILSYAPNVGPVAIMHLIICALKITNGAHLAID